MSAAEKQGEPLIDRLQREAFINLFLVADRLTGDVEAICKADGLTMSHYTVLWVVCLSPNPEGVPMRAIADDSPAEEKTALEEQIKQATVECERQQRRAAKAQAKADTAAEDARGATGEAAEPGGEAAE